MLEVAILDLKPGIDREFEAAFKVASNIIAGCQGILLTNFNIVWKIAIAIFYWYAGKSSKTIRWDLEVLQNINSGDRYCIISTIRFRQ